MSLVYEDTRMSYDELSNSSSPCKKSSGTSASRTPVPDLEKSWFELVQEEEQTKAQQNNAAATDSDCSGDELEDNMSDSKSSRQIEIDIFETANAEKYDKLVKDDKIKSPFKRRLSGESSETDCTGNSLNDADLMNSKRCKTDDDDGVRPRVRRESNSSGASSQNSRKNPECETDEAVLSRRQKQIDYGKNTLGYEAYLEKTPRNLRTKEDPKTPPKHLKYSRRAWDGLIRIWRKKLHAFDPNAQSNEDSN